MEAVPEFRHHYPLTLVMDAFADWVSAGISEGAPDELLDRCFGFVESLAATDSRRLHNLVIVCFIEAAMWGELGAKDRFGPSTKRLILEADPRMIDPELRA